MSQNKALEPDRIANSRYVTPANVGYWRVELREEVVSTQLEFPQDLAASDSHRVVVAEFQSGGRGRFDRRFESNRSLGLTFSMALVPTRDRAEWSWLPLMVGSAIVDALNDLLFSVSQIHTKWPNDIIDASGRKFGGILTESRGEGVVIGVGINVLEIEEELAVPHAISLAMASSRVRDGEIRREDILAALLDRIAERYQLWLNNGSDSFELANYKRSSLTLAEGERRIVRCELPGGKVMEGRVTGIKSDGALTIMGEKEEMQIRVGDVIHLR